MSAELDSTIFRQRITRLAAALPVEVSGKVLTEEAGQYVRQVIQFLPPKTRQQGDAAVKRDISRAIRVLDLAAIQDPALKKFLSQASIEDVQKFVDHAPGLRGLRVAAFDPELHTSRRNARGRVPRGTNPALVVGAKEDVRRYKERVGSRVGYLKSGYAPAATALGVNLPSWITAHGQNGQGSVRIDLNHPGMQSITISNRAGRYPDHARVARDALHARAEAIHTKTLRLLRGQAVNLGFMSVAS